MTDKIQLSRREMMVAGAALTGLAGAGTAAAQDGDDHKMPNLTGTSILITGCSSGFGRLGAELYARLGAKVFATMRNLPRPEAEELREVALRDQLDIEVIGIDVTSDEETTAGVRQAEELAGGAMDVVINNAGIALSGPVELQDMAAMQKIFDTNVFGCQRVARAALPAMRAAGKGLVFNISSQLGRVMIPGLGAYSGTKFALEALSEQMAYELAPRGIEVTIIQPGGYPTDIWENGDGYTAELLARLPDELVAGYPAFVERMGARSNPDQSTDPMDVPRAIADIIAMPAGTRPLRRAVHPRYKPQLGINEASRKAQLEWLGGSGYGPMIKAVHEN